MRCFYWSFTLNHARSAGKKATTQIQLDNCHDDNMPLFQKNEWILLHHGKMTINLNKPERPSKHWHLWNGDTFMVRTLLSSTYRIYPWYEKAITCLSERPVLSPLFWKSLMLWSKHFGHALWLSSEQHLNTGRCSIKSVCWFPFLIGGW
jgi:hypothetical protein